MSSADLSKHRVHQCEKNKALSSFSCFKALASLRARNETARAKQQPVPAFQQALDTRKPLSPCALAYGGRQFWEKQTLSYFAWKWLTIPACVWAREILYGHPPVPPCFPGCLPGQHSLAQSPTLLFVNTNSNLLWLSHLTLFGEEHRRVPLSQEHLKLSASAKCCCHPITPLWK